MAYSINPKPPKVRIQAILLVIKERAKVSTVARRYGVSRPTVYLWLKTLVIY